MEATHAEHEHGQGLNGLAFTATLHCLVGCVLGEVTGVAIGQALGWSDLGTVALAVGLAFLFGFSLTSIPLVRAGLAAGVGGSTAFAVHALSITIMEAIDNAFVLLVPGAMD